MARGIVPRQPSKSGKQAGAPPRPRSAKTGRKDRPPIGQGTSPLQKQSATKERVAKPPVKSVGKAKAVGGVAPAKGYNPVAPDRVKEILKRLDATYPNVTCALTHQNAWQLLVATILSAQCTDERVNKTTPELFRKYPDPQSLAKMQPEQIEPDIKSTGFFRNKAKSIVGAARKVVEEFGGEVPSDMDQLLTLPGVARKTGNVVLGTWFGKNEGVVVDTHVHRISRRLELTKESAPEKIEQELMQIIPRARWTSFSHQVIWHGRKLCVARLPKCAECPLENICHAADKTWSTVDIHKTAQPK